MAILRSEAPQVKILASDDGVLQPASIRSRESPLKRMRKGAKKTANSARIFKSAIRLDK